ncbi:MAG: DegV family protein [Anaerolineae bacterium]
MAQNASRIAIITDSTSDLPADLIAQYEIGIVPLYVVWGEEQLRDGVDIDHATFYERLKHDPLHPTTSQPTPADFVRAIGRAIEHCGADEVVIITISRNLSGTFASASAAQEMVKVPVHVQDSYSVSMGLGWQVLAAARAHEQGGGVPEMLAAAETVRQHSSVLFTVDSLEFLHKGGRIGGAARLIGTALQLKPLLCVDKDTGRIDAVERTRTRKKALQRVIEASAERLGPGRPAHVGVIDGAAPGEAAALDADIKAHWNLAELTHSPISPALGVHGGPGLIGIAAYSD